MTKVTLYCGLPDSPGRVDNLLVACVVKDLLTKHGFDGATIIPTLGVWKGKLEHGFKVEILKEDTFYSWALRKLCDDLSKEFDQKIIMVTRTDEDIRYLETEE